MTVTLKWPWHWSSVRDLRIILDINNCFPSWNTWTSSLSQRSRSNWEVRVLYVRSISRLSCIKICTWNLTCLDYTVNYRYLDIAFLDISLSRWNFESPYFLPSLSILEIFVYLDIFISIFSVSWCKIPTPTVIFTLLSFVYLDI
jgi:hypothetical protein